MTPLSGVRAHSLYLSGQEPSADGRPQAGQLVGINPGEAGSAWRAFAGGAPRTAGIADVPDVHSAKQIFQAYFPTELFPRVSDRTIDRLRGQFPNWDQLTPDVRVVRGDWKTLKGTMDTAGREVPWAVVTQISYGSGMGHPKIGLFRDAKFEGESTHTYLYHAAIGRGLRDDQGADYNRIDHIPRKASLFGMWVLSPKLCREGAHELHRRWEAIRWTGNAPGDCATFVNDFARHMASLGDRNNPFNFGIPSHTIQQGTPESRGMYAILQNAHRPPAGMIFVLDPQRYDAIASMGHSDGKGWIVDCDANEFNVTKQ